VHRSLFDDEYHDSLRSSEKRNAKYHHRHDSYEQILMDAYPNEPKSVRLVDERSVNSGKESRFVVKEMDGRDHGRVL